MRGVPVIGLLTKALEWLRSALAWALRRLRPDHASILGPSQFGFIANGSLPHLHVCVQVAPARRRRHRIPPHEHLVRSGSALLESMRIEELPRAPDHLDGDLVMFKVEESAEGFSGYIDRALVLRRTGFVELFSPVGTRPPEDGVFDIPISEVLAPLARMADAVRVGDYWRAVAGRSPRRWWRQRVDWRVWIAWTAQASTSNMRNWTGLTFPAVSPARRATAARVHFASTPIGAASMTNVPQSRDPRQLLEPVVDELLRWCGYYGDERRVIEETVSSVLSLDADGVAIEGAV